RHRPCRPCSGRPSPARRRSRPAAIYRRGTISRISPLAVRAVIGRDDLSTVSGLAHLSFSRGLPFPASGDETRHASTRRWILPWPPIGYVLSEALPLKPWTPIFRGG